MQKKRTVSLRLPMIGVILSLAWPTMLEQLMQTAVQYIDTAMVGTLGTGATAAVGATTTVSWLINSTVAALGIGFLSFIARACGAGDREAAARASSQAVLACLAVGTLFTVLTAALSEQIPVWMQVQKEIRPLAAQYFLILYLPMLPRTATILFGTILRAAGDSRSPMKVGLLVNTINIILNTLLIFPSREVSIGFLHMRVWGAGLGVIGAGLASAAAVTCGGICITWMLFSHPVVSPRGYRLRPDRKILSACMQTAVPNMFQRFAASLGYVAFAAMINALGETAAAAHTIANTVESAFYIPGFGMQTAAATLAGNAYGAEDRQQMEDLAAMFLPIELLLMTLSGSLLFSFAPPLVGLFSDSAAVITLGSTVLRMVAVSEPFYGFSIIVEGLMQGVGRTRAPFVYNVLGMWGVRIVGTFLCTRIWGFGLISAWACMIAHNLLLFVLFLICYIRKQWNPLARI